MQSWILVSEIADSIIRMINARKDVGKEVAKCVEKEVEKLFLRTGFSSIVNCLSICSKLEQLFD